MDDRRKRQDRLTQPDRRRDWDYETEREKWLLRRDRYIFAVSVTGLGVILAAALILDLSKNQAIILALITGFVSALGIPYAVRKQERRGQ